MAKKQTKKKVTIRPSVAQQDCETTHAGQSGYCDAQGNWHPTV